MRVARPLSARLIQLTRESRSTTTLAQCLPIAVRPPPALDRRTSYTHCISPTSRPHNVHIATDTRRFISVSSRRDSNDVTVVNPRKDESGSDMTIEIMPRASHRLASIMEKDSNSSLCLRVSVESGGCHGFQYLMSLTNIEEIDAEMDTVFISGDGKAARVVMDEASLGLLKGSKIDYSMELIGSQFKVTGIPGATTSCGCGTSFDVKI